MEEHAAEFIKKYYSVVDSSDRRMELENYYIESAGLMWNHNFIPSRRAIMGFFLNGPSMKHESDSIKANAGEEPIKIEVKGKISIDGGQEAAYMETFLVIPDYSPTQLGFKIMQQTFEFGY
ncbi:hypothetical protein DL93DRAFT_2232239 [Clavulina sp. PMI_390]|nr:hypothetical protein DL93DRAFT_2232239 [Clavulina sp. PMI_390]